MKKLLVASVCTLLAVSCMCSAAFAKTYGKKVKYDENDFENFKTIVKEDLFDIPVEFTLLPDGYNYHEPEHKGTLERLYYETDAYDDGVTYKKYCVVYLPYGYNPEDTEKKYNVLYFQHGNAQSPNAIWDRGFPAANTLWLMDNLFDPDHQLMDPFIIINPTYYFDCDEDVRYMDNPVAPAGDAFYEGTPGNYYREVVEDLIPQIESRYNVYCEDFSPEGIKASRDHRAWAGYSRGGCSTWYMLYHDIEYFGTFVPMSFPHIKESQPLDGESLADGTIYTPKEAYEHISEALTAHPECEVFIFTTCGNEQSDAIGNELIPQVQEYASHPEVFSFGPDPAVDNLYFCQSDFDHMDAVMPFTIYNARNVLFR